MFILEWKPITETEWIPPLGNELRKHLLNKKESGLYASCSAWGLLYQSLAENEIQAGKVAFKENGKPYFKEERVYFSLSHSRGLCAVAVSDCPVGVDIEIVKESYNPKMIERSLCDNEKAIYDGDFTRIWSRKEAVAKMTGIGITRYPADIDTTLYQFTEKRVQYDENDYWLVSACTCNSVSALEDKNY